ncbi:MAG: hypothetical protein QGM46_02875 [Actinomycetota bacterium]|nr:hypothetical protein [Actinomycetota bacterium]MDK1016178.1 hypothetical protein [Actinomycetota bacterium]MDK1026185.1 hypothetical protein [Actinomycetota bacterium]MDK1038709.1 hypothetical protein [Actinomycetota bacterium]MDK1096402.1 hypothetical protein [Actinomycetota bacterium]
MNSDTPGIDHDTAPPTEEIYIELRELEAAAADAGEEAAPIEPAPALPDDDLTGLKARIARLRAILSDRDAEPSD